MKRKNKPFSQEHADQMHELHDWIAEERIELWFGENKEKHKLKCIKLQRIYGRLRLSREGLI